MLYLPTPTLNYGQPVNWQSPLTRGLVGWWLTLPSRGKSATWFDLCGRYHGTLTNMDPATDWVGSLGRPGGFGCLDFLSTSTQYADVTTLTTITGSPFTLHGWAFRTGNAGTIASCINPALNNPKIQIASLNTGIIGRRQDASTTAEIIVTAAALSTWHAVTFVGYANDSYELFVNGLSVGTNATSVTGSSGGGFRIGRLRASSEFTGSIDNVRIYNRAMTAAEVWQMYQDDRQGNPQMLNWIEPYLVGEAAAPPAGGNRRRRMLMGAA